MRRKPSNDEANKETTHAATSSFSTPTKQKHKKHIHKYKRTQAKAVLPDKQLKKLLNKQPKKILCNNTPQCRCKKHKQRFFKTMFTNMNTAPQHIKKKREADNKKMQQWREELQ